MPTTQSINTSPPCIHYIQQLMRMYGEEARWASRTYRQPCHFPSSHHVKPMLTNFRIMPPAPPIDFSAFGSSKRLLANKPYGVSLNVSINCMLKARTIHCDWVICSAGKVV